MGCMYTGKYKTAFGYPDRSSSLPSPTLIQSHVGPSLTGTQKFMVKLHYHTGKFSGMRVKRIKRRWGLFKKYTKLASRRNTEKCKIVANEIY